MIEESSSVCTDVVDWAFGAMGLDPNTASFDMANNAMKRLQLETQLDDPQQKYAAEIVMSVCRYRAFVKDKEYNDAFMHPNAEFTTFQSLLVFLLRRLRENRYRRVGETCHEEIGSTRAWRYVCSIKEFVSREIKKELQPEQFKNLTNPRDNLDLVCRHLIEVTHPEFPVLVTDPMLISFNNGWYSVEDNVFWSSNSRAEWPRLRAMTQTERRASGWGEQYTLDAPRDDQFACAYVETEFRPWSSHGEEELGKAASYLTGMGIDPSLHGWLRILMGRMFFPLGERDRWEVMPFVRTNEASEVALAALFIELYRTIVGPNVPSIASGCNTSYSLDALVNGRMGFVLMRDGVMPLEQGDWQSAVSGEEVLVTPSGRSRTAYPRKWATPLMGIGSYIGYKNDAGTVCRRILMFDAPDATVSGVSELRDMLMTNLDYWLQASVAAYLTAVHDHDDHDVWGKGVLPEDMHAMRERVREMTNPLHTCLSSGMFTFNSSMYMPLSDFKDLYYEFRRARNLPNQRWVRDHWNNAFQDFKLTIERSQREYHGVKSTTEWLFGIDTTEKSLNLNISQDSIDALVAEQKRLEDEQDRVERRLKLSKELLDAETHILEWRTKRQALREELRVLLEEMHPDSS